MKHPLEEAAGVTLTLPQLDRLTRYEMWLSSEAAVAGAIGPVEQARLEIRHIGGSLAYARLLPAGDEPVYDLGSGAGLPGIPLAIALAGRQFVLNDRSQRRIDLIERVIRILALDNIRVEKQDMFNLGSRPAVAVARAVLPPDRWPSAAARILQPGGLLVVGVGEGSPTPDSRPGLDVRRHDVDLEVLDRPITFLTMHKRE